MSSLWKFLDTSDELFQKLLNDGEERRDSSVIYMKGGRTVCEPGENLTKINGGRYDERRIRSQFKRVG